MASAATTARPPPIPGRTDNDSQVGATERYDDASRSPPMHIKQITISGFKSYRDATLVGPLCRGHNVVVGRNGSGKSNFFDAVRFVLSDSDTPLYAEQRVKLLHEGASAAVLTAYVEIVFDNTSRRLHIDSNEVRLRRMVGIKKDEFTLNGRITPRMEVISLFEAAGFSQSNPYYIVQQGKVAALCSMTDGQRLELLQEVAGVNVYNARKAESLQILAETDTQRAGISEAIEFIEKKLSDLESEKEDLKIYHKFEKERKALQYTICVRELEEAKAALESLDGDTEDQRSRSTDLLGRLSRVRNDIDQCEMQLKSIVPEISRLEDEKKTIDDSRKDSIDMVAKLEVKVSSAEQNLRDAKASMQSNIRERENINRLIEQKKEELGPLEDNLKTAKKQESDTRRRISELESKLLSLRVKADRKNHFRTERERNNHIRRTIREANRRKSSLQQQLEASEQEQSRLQNAVVENGRKLESARQELDSLRTAAQSATSDLTNARRGVNERELERATMWKKVRQLEFDSDRLQTKLRAAQDMKRSKLGAGAYAAIAAVMRAADEDQRNLGRNRVFGPLLDLISVERGFEFAIDVTAGSALSHVVVDTDATAARLVRFLQTKRAGRVTFIPLNRLEKDPRPLPGLPEGVLALESKVSCGERFRPAVHQIFGRWLVTNTVREAADISRDYGFDCVTLEGDLVNRRGAMSGGYYDKARSRIIAENNVRAARSELQTIERQADEARRSAQQMDDVLARMLGDVQNQEAANRNTSSKLSRLQYDINKLEKYLDRDNTNIPRAADRISAAKQAIETTEREIQELNDELSSPMTSAPSAEEEELKTNLTSEIEQLNSSIQPIVEGRAQLERQVVSVRSELKEDLEKRKERLEQDVQTRNGEGEGIATGVDIERAAQETLEREQEALKAAQTKLQSIRASLRENQASLSERRTSRNRLETQLEKDRHQESQLNRSIEEDAERVAKRYSQRSVEQKKKADAETKIKELGSLPADFDRYRPMSASTLMRRLGKANEELKKLSHVNKRALEQFMNFSEEKAKLIARRDELDSGATAIRHLIEALDARKDNDILRTYKGTSMLFSKVFAELVPGGKAALVMLKSGGEGGTDIESDAGGRINYRGVAIKVAFNNTGRAYLLQQLSGGQKSVVALSLIFALQRLDPAPFYLFDEIDANLDATYRQAVANLIRKQAREGTQFLCTTFRPEIVNAGDRWYGVTHRRKVSTIQEVDRSVALTFISDERDEQQQEATAQ